MADLELCASIDQILVRHSLSLDDLRREASAIILFGSRAAGCARETSDWDLLCIGRGRSRKLAGLDLVWIDISTMEHDAFLGGELAGHVLRFGCWLHGEASWKASDLRVDAAARRKEERLAKRLRSYERAWHLLGAAYQDQDARLLRRDVQRLGGLRAGIAVPPSAHLDAAWTKNTRSATWLHETLRLLGAQTWLAEEIASREAVP
jgi:hypothetical protein